MVISRRPVTTKERFFADEVKVLGITPNVRIQVHEKPYIGYEFHGTFTQYATVGTSMDGGVLVVEPVISPIDTTDITDVDKIVLPARVIIKVPTRTPVEIKDILGGAKVGDTDGPLSVSIEIGKVTAGHVSDVSLRAKNGGYIAVEEVSGVAYVRVKDGGVVIVARSSVTELDAFVKRSGRISFGGIVKKATLVVTGIGSMFVHYIEEPPVKSVSRSGELRINSIGSTSQFPLATPRQDQ